MSSDKQDFYGKEVAEAIKKACDTLNISQEKLDIEVVETGSTGIFGLIRKKAHIRVSVKPDSEDDDESIFALGTMLADSSTEIAGKPAATAQETLPEEPSQETLVEDSNGEESDHELENEPDDSAEEESDDEEDTDDDSDDDSDENGSADDQGEILSIRPESIEIVRQELLQIVSLMGFPAELEIAESGQSIVCTLRGEYEEDLTGPDGKVLDSLQYLLRKIVSRKVPERIRLSVNVGDFRERRLEELKARAVELAGLVKNDGKTQVLPALNPSERREIHMVLQEDKEIRSRSVGDGLFKKILIYKPGKGNRGGGRKRSGGRNKQAKSGRKQERDS